MRDLKPIACAMPDGRIAVYIGSDYKYLPAEKAMELVAQLCAAVGDGNPDDSQLDHAVHAYKVASVARMAMETDPKGSPTVAVLDASIREGVRAALAAARAKGAQVEARCGTCGDIIKPDQLTGTTCACAHADRAAVTGDDKILWGVVANAGRMSRLRKPRWSHVSDATAQGSNSSAELCRRFGFDPDEEIPGRPHQPSRPEATTHD